MKKVGKLMEGGEMLAAYRARSDSDERKRDRKTKRIILSEYNRQMLAKGIFAKSFRQAAKRTATARRAFVAVALASAASLSQSKGETSHAAALEFPVVLQQNVVAGKTAVGAKVQAKLTIATLLHGVVIPQDAVISGEVIESVAKSATEPSRVAVRMDTAQWKNGAAPSVLPLETKLYLTAWYYPLGGGGLQFRYGRRRSAASRQFPRYVPDYTCAYHSGSGPFAASRGDEVHRVCHRRRRSHRSDLQAFQHQAG